jgi:hypothetical protein
MKTPTMIKLAADGQELPADATDWVAVKLPEHGLIFTATQINEEETDQEPLQAQAAALDLLGATDWDLPTIDELQLLVDRERYNPAINTEYFRDIQNDWYWSKTPAAWSSASAWGVSFYLGFVYGGLRDDDGFALAVRRVGQ